VQIRRDVARKTPTSVPGNTAQRDAAVTHCSRKGKRRQSVAARRDTKPSGDPAPPEKSHLVELRIHSQTAQSQQRYRVAAVVEANGPECS
jgi:hypothetical protein